MLDRYKKYCKISKDDMEILECYIFERFGSIEAFTMKVQRELYNTMDFGMYKLNYLFGNL